MMKLVMEWSQGNPGAMTFLLELISVANGETLTTIEKITEMKTLRGTNLYVLWSDICDKDMKNVHEVVKTIPADILEDACNRQDYSGKKIVLDYFSKLEKEVAK